MIAPALYYFTPSALTITLNIDTGENGFTKSETCSVSVASGAAIKVANQLVTQAQRTLDLGYNEQLGYRKFIFTGYNTVFGYPGDKYIAAPIYVYIRLDASNNGSTGELVFLPYEVDYDGCLLMSDGSPVAYTDIGLETLTDQQGNTYYSLPNTNTANTSGLNYYYIHIATISTPDNGERAWLYNINSGQLETAKGNNEDATGLWTRMFQLVNNVIHVLLPFDKLSFAASGDAYIDRIITTTASTIEGFSNWAYAHGLATTASIASYVSAKLSLLDDKYFRKDIPDTSPYTATFGNLHVKAGLTQPPLEEGESPTLSPGNLLVDGDLTVDNDTSIGGELSVGETAIIPTINPNAIPSNFPDPEGSVSNPWGISQKGIAKLTKLLIEEIQNVGGTDLESLLGQGFLYKMDEYGKAHVFTDYLTVRLKAYFAELEIRRLSYVGGSIVLTPAGSKVKGVVWLDANGEVLTQEAGNRSSVKVFKVYEEADDGTFATQNGWKVGDMARCETFNIDGAGKYQDVSNTYYWRLVTDAGQVRLDSDGNEVGQNAEGYADAKVTNFIILSNEASVEVDNVVLVGYDLSGDNDFPSAGDTLVQMGNQFPTNHADENYSTRGNIIMLRTVSESANPDGAPSIVMYKNVGSVDAGSSNPYTLANRQIMKFGLDGLTVISDYFTLTSQRGDVRPVSFYRGDWSATDTYNERDTVTYDDRLWQCLQDNVTGSGTHAPYIGSPYWQCVVKGKSTSIYSIECSTYLVSTASLSNVVPTVLGAEMDSALYPVLFGEYLLKIGEEEEGSTAVISIKAVLQDGEGKSYLDSGTLVVQNMVGSAVINTIDTSTTGEISILYSDIDPNADRVRISYRADGTNEDAATSITLVRNGVDGSAVRIDLDNENDSMLYDERGTLISGNVVSNVSLYDGMDDKTSEVVALGGFSIAASSGCTASISDNVVTVTGMSATSGYVTVQASYNSKTWRTKLTLKKIVNGRKFEIVATPTSIAKNTTTGIQSSGSIECVIYVTDKEGRRKVTNLTDEGVVLYFGAKLANGNEDYNNVNSAYSSSGFVVNNLSPTSEKAFFFRLTDATNQSTILDEETIPINRSADGANADSAPYLTINPSTIFFEKDANEEVEATKSYISNVKMYHNNVEVTLVNVTIDSAPSGATVNLEDIEYNTAQISVALAKNTSAASVSGVIAFTVAGTLNNESYTCKGFITLAGVPAGTAGVDAEFIQLVDEGSSATIGFTYDDNTMSSAASILSTAVLKLNIKASAYKVLGNTQSLLTETGYSLKITYGYGESTVNTIPAQSADSTTHLFTYETTSPHIAIGANFTPSTGNSYYMTLSPTITLQLLDSNNNVISTLQVPIEADNYDRYIRNAHMMQSVYSYDEHFSSFTQTAEGFSALVVGLGVNSTYSTFDMSSSEVIFDTQKFTLKYGNQSISIFEGNKIRGDMIKLEGYTVINNKFRVAENGDVWMKNCTVEGVLNNLINTVQDVDENGNAGINEDTLIGADEVDANGNYLCQAQNYASVGYDSIYCLDVLCLGDVIKLTRCNRNRPYLALPYFLSHTGFFRPATRYGGTLHRMTKDEMLQLVGRKITLIVDPVNGADFSNHKVLVPTITGDSSDTVTVMSDVVTRLVNNAFHLSANGNIQGYSLDAGCSVTLEFKQGIMERNGRLDECFYWGVVNTVHQFTLNDSDWSINPSS